MTVYVSEAGGSGREELKMVPLFPCCPVNRECYVKENPDRKKHNIVLIMRNGN